MAKAHAPARRPDTQSASSVRCAGLLPLPGTVPVMRIAQTDVRLRPTALAVQAHPVLLEQVLRNLLSNALRYTQQGGVLVAARTLPSGAVRLQV